MENKKYWFKRKRYGYGFYPVTKKGWALILIYIILLTVISLMWEKNILINNLTYTLSTLGLTTILLYLSFKNSPKAKWRWGSKKEDNPAEDF